MTGHRISLVRLQLVLLDDHRAAREALVRRLCQCAEVDVAGHTADIDEAVELLKRHHPHAVLVDPRREDGAGIDAIASLVRVDMPVRPLVAAHASYFDADEWLDVRAAGAQDWILKQFDVDALVTRLSEAIERGILAGH